MQGSAISQEGKSRKLQIFSERLKARRHRLGISQETLALKAKASPRSIVAWESGNDNIPQGIKLSQLAEALGVDVSWLIGEESQELRDMPAPRVPPQSTAPSPYSMMEVSTLEKALIDLSQRLPKSSPHERKHVLGNIADVVAQLEVKELSLKPLSEAQRIAKDAGDRHDAENADKS